MEIASKALLAIRKNMKCRNRLAFELNKSQQTIARWLDDNDILLTTAAALQIIREETGLTDDEILVQEPASK